MKLAPKVLIGFSAMPLLLALLLLGTTFLALSPGVYFNEYDKLHQEVTIGCDRETLDAVAVELIDYMSGKRDTLDGVTGYIMGEYREIFSQRDKLHMVDVKNLFIAARYGVLIGVLLCAALLVISVPRLDKARRWKSAAACFLVGIGAFFAATALLAIVIASNFEAAFVRFHLLFFNNDLWLLPADSVLLQMMPTQFFMDLASYIGIFFGAGTLALILVCVLIRQLSGRGIMSALTARERAKPDDAQPLSAPEAGVSHSAPAPSVERAPRPEPQSTGRPAHVAPPVVAGSPKAVGVSPEITAGETPVAAAPVSAPVSAPAAVSAPVAVAAPVAASASSVPVEDVTGPISAVSAQDGERFVINNADGERPRADDIFEKFGLSDADDQPLMPDERIPSVRPPAMAALTGLTPEPGPERHTQGSGRAQAPAPVSEPMAMVNEPPSEAAPEAQPSAPVWPVAAIVPAMPALYPFSSLAGKAGGSSFASDPPRIAADLPVHAISVPDQILEEPEAAPAQEPEAPGDVTQAAAPEAPAQAVDGDEPITLRVPLRVPLRLPSSALHGDLAERGLRLELSIRLADDLSEDSAYDGAFPDSVEAMKQETLAAMMAIPKEGAKMGLAMMDAVLSQLDQLLERLPAVEE